jgi:hypothetical protein
MLVYYKEAWYTRSIREQKWLSRLLYARIRQTNWKIGEGVSAWQLGIFVSEDTQRLFSEIRYVLEMCSIRWRSSIVWSLCKQRKFDLNLRWNPLQLLFFKFTIFTCFMNVLLVYYYRLLQKNFSFLTEVQLFINYKQFQYCSVRHFTILTFVGPCIVIRFYSKTKEMHQFLKFILFCSSTPNDERQDCPKHVECYYKIK